MPDGASAGSVPAMRGPGRRGRARAVALGAILAVTLVAPAGPGPAPAAAAGSIKAVTIDALETGGSHVLQTWTEPAAALDVTWASNELIVNAQADGDVTSQIIRLGPRQGDPLVAGSYEAPGFEANVTNPFLVRQQGGPGGYTCEGDSFTIHGISPEPQPNVDTAIDALSASFTQECPGYRIRGEIRWNSSLGFSSIGPSADPRPLAGMSLSGESFAGRYSPASPITLRNWGSQPLTFGQLELLDEAVDRWFISSDTCSGKLIAPNATCTIAGQAVDWIPNIYQDSLRLPVSTARGEVRIQLVSVVLSARFVPIKPVRLLDTRHGIGISGRLPNKAARTLTVVNRTPGDAETNIPPQAVAVAGNLTITGQSTAGHAALTTSLLNDPKTSTLNVPFGDTRANGTIVRLTSGGTLGITWVGANGSNTHAVFDATGYFVPVELSSGVRHGNFSAGFSPSRVLNSRTGQGFSGALRPNQPRTFTVPLAGVWNQSVAVTGNLTVVRPSGAGHVTIGPAPVTNPGTSTLNFPAGDTRANNVLVRLGGTAGTKSLSVTYVGPPNTTAHVIFDVTGAFGPSGSLGYVPLEPSRVVDSRIGKGITTGRIPAETAKDAWIENQYPSDPSRNLPPDNSTSETLFKHAIAGNATFVGPTRPGHLAVVGSLPASEPNTSTINSPAGDTRANGVIIAGCCPPSAAFWYEAAPDGFTHVVLDVYGYFIQ
jgi:hypothetical protein